MRPTSRTPSKTSRRNRTHATPAVVSTPTVSRGWNGTSAVTLLCVVDFSACPRATSTPQKVANNEHAAVLVHDRLSLSARAQKLHETLKTVTATAQALWTVTPRSPTANWYPTTTTAPARAAWAPRPRGALPTTQSIVDQIPVLSPGHGLGSEMAAWSSAKLTEAPDRDDVDDTQLCRAERGRRTLATAAVPAIVTTKTNRPTTHYLQNAAHDIRHRRVLATTCTTDDGFSLTRRCLLLRTEGLAEGRPIGDRRSCIERLNKHRKLSASYTIYGFKKTSSKRYISLFV